MVGWHHRLNRHEFEQVLGDSEGQGRLACCSSWGQKEWNMTEWLNDNNNKSIIKGKWIKCTNQKTQTGWVDEKYEHMHFSWASLVERIWLLWETWVWSLGWEDPLEDSMASHPSILAWRRILVSHIHRVTKSQTPQST